MSRHGKPSRPELSPNSADAADHSERLQKLLAAAGLGSRRQCEELISTGRVEVDHKVVTELGSKADPRRQEIRVDGIVLPRPRLVHYMLNKPVGIVSTNHDPSGRPRVIDLIPGGDRLFTIGRLDMSSEGLILITNDGDLAHPRYEIEKTYHVEVAGTIGKEDLAKLQKGVYLAEGFAKVKHVKIKSQYKQSALLEIVLDEGRNREIRRLLARVGHKVLRLKRIALGPLRMGELEVGAHRPLTHEELRDLRQATTPEGRRQRRKARANAEQKRPTGAAGKPAIGGVAKPAAADRPKRPAPPVAIQPRRPTIIGGDVVRPARKPATSADSARPARKPAMAGSSARPPRKPVRAGGATRPPRRPVTAGDAGRSGRKPARAGDASRPARKPGRAGAPAARKERRK